MVQAAAAAAAPALDPAFGFRFEDLGDADALRRLDAILLDFLAGTSSPRSAAGACSPSASPPAFKFSRDKS